MLSLLFHLLSESGAPLAERRYQYVRAIHRQTLTALARAQQNPDTDPRMLVTLARAAEDFDAELRRLEPFRLHHRQAADDSTPLNSESREGR